MTADLVHVHVQRAPKIREGMNRRSEGRSDGRTDRQADEKPTDGASLDSGPSLLGTQVEGIPSNPLLKDISIQASTTISFSANFSLFALIDFLFMGKVP